MKGDLSERKWASEDGLTLVELLLVFAVIATLLLLSLPGVHYLRRQARQTGCIAALGRLAIPASAFQADHRGFLPPRAADTDPARSFMFYFQPYITPETAYLCPETPAPDGRNRPVIGGVNAPWHFVGTTTFKDYSSYGLSYSHSMDITGGPSTRAITFKAPYSLPTHIAPHLAPMFLDCTWPGFKPDDDWDTRVPVARHQNGVNILFTDKSARHVKANELRGLIWSIDYVAPPPSQ